MKSEEENAKEILATAQYVGAMKFTNEFRAFINDKKLCTDEIQNAIAHSWLLIYLLEFSKEKYGSKTEG